MNYHSRRIVYAACLFLIATGALGQSNPIHHYLVSVAAPPTRSVPFSITVTAQDANNHTVTSDSSTVVTLLGGTANVLFDPNGDNSFSGNTVRLTNGTFSVNAKDVFAETVSISVNDASRKGGTNSSVTINHQSGDYQSNGTSGGAWDAAATWRTWNGSAWVATDQGPTGAAGEDVTVLTGDTVNLRGAVSLVGGLTVNGTLSFSGSGVLTVGSGGIVRNAGSVGSSMTTLVFNSGALYQHNFTTNQGTIPAGSWNIGSTCAIIGYTTCYTNPVGLGQSFYHFTWNCPNQSSDTALGAALTTVRGDLTILNTGRASVKLSGDKTLNATTTVSGGYRQGGGVCIIASTSSSTATQTLDVESFVLSGGTFTMNIYNGAAVLNIRGDFSVTGVGQFTQGSGTSRVYFEGSSPQNFTNSGSIQGASQYFVNAGSALLMGTNPLTGAGSFTLSAGATLGIGHTTGVDGNLAVSGTKTLSTAANFVYNGSAAQAAGSLLPTTLSSLTINNTSGPVTLGKVTKVTGSLALADAANLGLPSGISGANTLTIGGAGQPPGKWGNAGSGADHIDSAHFSGAGVLIVTSGPNSSITLASTPNPSSYGEPVTFTATVTGSAPQPTGTVTLSEGSTVLGTDTLNGSGMAVFVVNTLSVASSPHSLVAVYSGDSNHSGSTSSAVLQVVNPAATFASLSTSLNPALPSDNVTFTAVVTNSPLDLTPTGTVQFAVAGSDVGPPLWLSGGQASLTLPGSSLRHGSQSIAVRFLPADGNFVSSTATLVPEEVVNTPPGAGDFELGVPKNTPGSFSTSKLLKAAADADGDALSITAVSSVSAQGASVSFSDSMLTYTPPTDYAGPDTFTYTLSDGWAAVTGTVSVTIGGCSSRISTLIPQGDGTMKLLASGLPGQAYSIEASVDMSSWVEIGSAVAAGNGLIEFIDEQAATYSNRNYRLVEH